jgi:hypothetical protein
MGFILSFLRKAVLKNSVLKTVGDHWGQSCSKFSLYLCVIPWTICFQTVKSVKIEGLEIFIVIWWNVLFLTKIDFTYFGLFWNFHFSGNLFAYFIIVLASNSFLKKIKTDLSPLRCYKGPSFIIEHHSKPAKQSFKKYCVECDIGNNFNTFYWFKRNRWFIWKVLISTEISETHSKLQFSTVWMDLKYPLKICLIKAWSSEWFH